MDLEKFARVFGLEYSARPRELPPLPYFSKTASATAHTACRTANCRLWAACPKTWAHWAGFTAISASAGWKKAAVFCRC